MKSTVLRAGAGLAVLLLLGGTLALLRDQFLVNPFQAELSYEYPGFAASDREGSTYLIDRSLKRIVKTRADGELAWTIPGGSREPGSFFFADELTVDSRGFLYVLNRVPDAPGFYTVLAQVLRYTPDGRFDRIVASKEYGPGDRVPTLVQRAQWHSLQAAGTLLRWFDSTTTGLVLYEGEPDAVKARHVAPGLAADLLVPGAAVLPDGRIAAVTKQGRVVLLRGAGEPEVLFDASGAASGSTPWKVRATGDGRILFTDLARGGIAELLTDGTAPLRASTEGAATYSLSVSSEGVLGTTGDSGTRFFTTEGLPVPTSDSARYPWTSLALHFGLWLALAGSLAALVWLGRLIYIEGFRRVIPPFLKTVAAVVVLTGSVGFLVAVMILNNFSQRYSSEVLSKITQLVHLVPRIIDTDAFTALNEPAQLGGPAYNALRRSIIDTVYGEKQDENQGLYFALHKVSGNQGLTTLMYLNGDTTIRHPFAYLNDQEGPYQKALKGETVAQYALDAWGSWMYSTGPIRDKAGTVVGVFEMGGDLYSFTQENNRLIASLLVNILTVLVVFLLMLVEMTFLQDQLRKRTLEQALAEQGVAPRRVEDRFHRAYLVRPVTALFFTAASVPLLFLPLLMKEYYQPLFGLPESVVYGLPVSIRLLFFGLGTVLGGNLTRRWGWKAVFLAGLALSAAGLGASALAPEMFSFLAASVAVGLGAGFGMIGLRSLVNAEADAESKAPAYGHFYAGIIAGTNVGVIVGSALADLLGYANVFWLALGLVGAAFVLVVRLFPGRAVLPPPASADLGIGQALGRFFGDPALLRFAVLIVLPVYVASMVLYFFLPVFAQTQGVTSADTGRIFLLNGLLVIYLGPALSRTLQTRLGPKNALAVSSLLWFAALIPFTVTGDLMGLILTIALMGVAEGTAAVAQNEHLLGLRVAGAVGGDRAAGFFEVVAKVGETLAPILIGFAMLLGPRWGIGLVAGCLGAAIVLFRLTEAWARRREVRS